MSQGSLAIIAAIGGVTIQKTINKSGDHPNVYGDANAAIALAAGTAVATWTKTDANTGTATLAAGHGHTSGVFDVYWLDGVRYGMTGTVTENSLALDAGAGDDFPETATEDMVVCPVQQINTAIDGDAITLIAMNATQRANLRFEDATAATIAAVALPADVPFTWHDSSGVANPFTGNPITVCYASNGTTTASVLTILSLEDSTP
jgi:hypothetical protein